MDNPRRTILLFCWILEVSHSPFPVDIDDSRTVGHLKKAIVKEKSATFANIEADQLTLWKTSIPIGTTRTLKNEVAKQKFLDDDALPEADPLSDIFPHPEPAKRTLHIVIRTPPIVPHPGTSLDHPILELNCFVHDDDPRHVFPVKIARTESVGTFKKAIKEEKKVALEHVDADALRLWKVSIPVNGGFKENVSGVELKDEDELSPVDTLSDVFSEVPARKHLHIIVLCSPPNAAEHARSHPPSAFKPLPDDVQQARQKRNRRAADKPPSTAGIPKEFEKLQTGSAGPVFAFYRPPSAAATIPITLLHPVFGQFVDDRQNHTPTMDDNELVLSLSRAMSKFYVDEYARSAKFREILMEHGIMLAVSEIEGSRCKTDGDLRWKGLCYIILEAKNELGGGGAEPLFEAMLYYLKSMRKRSEEDARARLPSLILYLSGAHIGFAGAVYTDGPSAEVLSVTLPLCVPETDVELRTLAARHFGALKKAVFSLSQCYNQKSSGSLHSLPDARYPFKSSFTALHTSAECRFEYLSPISGKLVFFAKTENNEKVCVKFARRYSMEAHSICASMGFAPGLKGFERVAGGWYMIVMDAITDEFGHVDKPSASLYKPIQEKVVTLHQQGYVHGDLRDINLMVRKNGAPEMMLFDFDWAGEIGKVRYPINVNRGPHLKRPDGAYDGELITAEHDMEMLDIMFKAALSST